MNKDTKDPFFLINEDIARVRNKIKKDMAPQIGLCNFDTFFQNLRLKHFNDNRHIKQLIVLLAADFFWETFFSSSINNEERKIPLQEFPDEIVGLIQMHRKYSIEVARTGLIRAIYLLNNINPYKEQNIIKALRYGVYELENLRIYFKSIKNIHDIENYWPLTDKPYDNWSLEEKTAFHCFEQESYLSALGPTFPEIIIQATRALVSLWAFNREDVVNFRDISILWGGTFEAFKNELRTRKKNNMLIIRTIIDGRGGYEWKLDEEDRLPYREDAYKYDEARAWLSSKNKETHIENIQLTMPPLFLENVQGDTVSMFNALNRRNVKNQKEEIKILNKIKNLENKLIKEEKKLERYRFSTPYEEFDKEVARNFELEIRRLRDEINVLVAEMR